MKKTILLFLTILFYFESILADIKIKPLLEGNVDAKISLIVYESLTCGHCAKFHTETYPKLKKDFIDTGLVKIEFRSFPLDLASFNASKIAHCKNDGKSDLLHFLYENQKKWVQGETIEEIIKHLKKLIVTNLPFDFTEFEKYLILNELIKIPINTTEQTNFISGVNK